MAEIEGPPQGAQNHIDRLPTELLLTVMENSCPLSHGIVAYRAVLTLAGVCHKWREAVLNTPTFWTHVTLHPQSHEHKTYLKPIIFPSYPARLVLQLERTKTAPLEIRWVIDGEPHPQLVDIIQSLAPLSRWRTFSLYLSTKRTNFFGPTDSITLKDSGSLIPRVIGAFDNLKKLSLYGLAECPSYWIDLLETTALRLERLEIGGECLNHLQRDLLNTSQRVSELVTPRSS